MRAGIDIRIDADGNPRNAAHSGGKPREQFEFGLGLDVDAENVLAERLAQFGFGLADAGEHDLLRRKARGQRALQLAAGDHVGVRRQALPACAVPIDWSWPSSRSRPVRPHPRRRRQTPGSDAPGSRSNSNRMACRPRPPVRRDRPPRRAARRCGSRNDSWQAQSELSSGSRMNGRLAPLAALGGALVP